METTCSCGATWTGHTACHCGGTCHETFDEYMKRNTYDPAQFMAYNAGDYSADELDDALSEQ